MTALVAGALVAVVAVLLVALPFLRAGDEEAGEALDAPTAAQERQRELIEARDQALAALRELEFDHRTGKVGDEDYRELVGPLRRRAAEALREIDRARGTED
jgi:transposase